MTNNPLLFGPNGKPFRRTGEASLLPYGEQPVAPVDVDERLENHQISGVYWITAENYPDDVPEGSVLMAWAFTTSAMLLLFAQPVMEQYRGARLISRYLMPQARWTKKMTEEFKKGEGRATADDFMKQRLQGQVIKHFARKREPTRAGGEEAFVAFSSGEGAHIVATPGQIAGATADLGLRLLPKGSVTIGPLLEP